MRGVVYASRRCDAPAEVLWSCGNDVADLQPRHDLQSYAVYFEWASPARGSLQLALALLAHFLDDDKAALEAHGAFRVHVIDHLRKSGWIMSWEQVVDWYKRWESCDEDLRLRFIPSELKGGES